MAMTVLGFGILAPSGSPAAVLFSQPFNASSTQTYYSETPGYPNVYDDFALAGGGIISNVDWYGIDPNDDITGFTVSFYSDTNGLPGTKLSSITITGSAGETASGSDNGPYPINDYAVNLATTFTASPDTEYYIQIQGSSSGAGGFYWETSSQGNDGALSGLSGDNPSPLNNNLAFALNGTPLPAPEPNPLMLGWIGAALFLFRRQRPGARADSR